jgi:hypothetical protein
MVDAAFRNGTTTLTSKAGSFCAVLTELPSRQATPSLRQGEARGVRSSGCRGTHPWNRSLFPAGFDCRSPSGRFVRREGRFTRNGGRPSSRRVEELAYDCFLDQDENVPDLIDRNLLQPEGAPKLEWTS